MPIQASRSLSLILPQHLRWTSSDAPPTESVIQAGNKKSICASLPYPSTGFVYRHCSPNMPHASSATCTVYGRIVQFVFTISLRWYLNLRIIYGSTRIQWKKQSCWNILEIFPLTIKNMVLVCFDRPMEALRLQICLFSRRTQLVLEVIRLWYQLQ